MRGLAAALAACALLAACDGADAEQTLRVRAGGAVYRIDPATLAIHAQREGDALRLVLPALLEPGAGWAHVRDGQGWRWDKDGESIALRADGPDLSLSITRTGESQFSAAMARAGEGDSWSIPDGEGVAFSASDPYWRGAIGQEACLSATAQLSLPAWSLLSGDAAITVMLADGLQSELCLHDEDGVQARIAHRFSPGAERLELLIHVGPADPLAPALAYRALLQRRGLFVGFADKQVPELDRLWGAPHAYVWGAARQPAFLERLHGLGIERMLIAYDQNPREPRGGLVTPAYLARAAALGYLAGPYEAFENAQPPETADAPTAIWAEGLYPAGCIRDRDGAIVPGFANRGCELSSEALRQQTAPPTPASRYAGHARDGATHVFVDVDAFGSFHEDFSPAHPMTMARDRENLFARLSLGIEQQRLVLGSEHVHAWSHGAAHYSHGSAQAHVAAIWPVAGDRERFGGWWPPERPAHFFKPVTLDETEAHALFGPADQLPLFEAAFHDSVVSTDRWEFAMTKLVGLERQRFARALLYGTPTMWNLDATQFDDVGAWLKAAHDAFRSAHGWQTPAALTGFAWLSAERLVQETRFADGRAIVANFSAAPWQGIGPDCVRVTRAGAAPLVLCPPETPLPH